MTIQTAVFIETLKALGSDPSFCSRKKISTQDHATASMMCDKSAAVFNWKGKILNKYCYYTLNAFMWPEDDGKGRVTDLIVDDGGDMTLPIHEVNKAEDFLLKYGPLPDTNSTENSEFKIVLNIIKRLLKGG